MCWDQHLPTLLPSPVTEAGKHFPDTLAAMGPDTIRLSRSASRDIRKTKGAEALEASGTFMGDMSHIPCSGHGHQAGRGTGPEESFLEVGFSVLSVTLNPPRLHINPHCG